jgi:hypothetical protein
MDMLLIITWLLDLGEYSVGFNMTKRLVVDHFVGAVICNTWTLTGHL